MAKVQGKKLIVIEVLAEGTRVVHRRNPRIKGVIGKAINLDMPDDIEIQGIRYEVLTARDKWSIPGEMLKVVVEKQAEVAMAC